MVTGLFARTGGFRGSRNVTDFPIRSYDAIDNGVADLSDPTLKDRIAELRTRLTSTGMCRS